MWEFTFTQVFSVKLKFTAGFAILIIVQILVHFCLFLVLLYYLYISN